MRLQQQRNHYDPQKPQQLLPILLHNLLLQLLLRRPPPPISRNPHALPTHTLHPRQMVPGRRLRRMHPHRRPPPRLERPSRRHPLRNREGITHLIELRSGEIPRCRERLHGFVGIHLREACLGHSLSGVFGVSSGDQCGVFSSRVGYLGGKGYRGGCYLGGRGVCPFEGRRDDWDVLLLRGGGDEYFDGIGRGVDGWQGWGEGGGETVGEEEGGGVVSWWWRGLCEQSSKRGWRTR
mmetsp:Transcript_1032/g.2321  ORF Transcript_1032/g.2321 Transcript_1032/m.2321 type:complete len:236 (-) Transcript_1032:1157-1864(-)